MENYTYNMFVQDVKAFEKKHGQVKFSKKCLKDYGIKRPKFNNKCVVILDER